MIFSLITVPAHNLFDEMPSRNLISYNAAIAASARSGLVEQSISLLFRMMLSGVRPSESSIATILTVLPAGASHTRRLHALALKTGLLHGSAYVGTAMLGVLGRSGDIAAAAEIFWELGSRRSAVTWNAMIAELSRSGRLEEALELFAEFRRTGITLSESSLVVVLSAVREIRVLEAVHALAVQLGMEDRILVGNSLVSGYLRIGFDGELGRKMLWSMRERDVATWNAMIAGLRKRGDDEGALRFVSLMGSVDGLVPNGRTIAAAISAAAVVAVAVGESLHGKAVVLGLEDDDFVATSLVSLYVKLGHASRAWDVFDKMPERRVATWNALDMGSIVVVREMLRHGGAAAPNEFSFSSTLANSTGDVTGLRQLHCLVVKLGFDRHGRVTSAAICSYAAADKSFDPSSFVARFPVLPASVANAVCGILNQRGDYRKTIEIMSRVMNPDRVSCNIHLAACVRSGDRGGAAQLFKQMLSDFRSLDDHTAVSYLHLCKNQCDVESGMLFHGMMIKTSFLSFDVFSHNSLLNMYAKCGCLEGCRKVFDEMPERNIATWTGMVAALGIHGGAAEALAMFGRMEEECRPDELAFLAAMSACRHGGMVEEGMELLRQMETGGNAPPPGEEHYACVVELLCKCGKMKDAERIISTMPFDPRPRIWRVFLRGCADLNTQQQCQANVIQC